MKKRVKVQSDNNVVEEYVVDHKRMDDLRYSLEYKDTKNSLVRIKAGKETLCVQRVAEDMSTLLYFKQGERVRGKATTPYGDVEITTLTKDLRIDENKIIVHYTIEGNDAAVVKYCWEIMEEINE